MFLQIEQNIVLSCITAALAKPVRTKVTIQNDNYILTFLLKAKREKIV